MARDEPMMLVFEDLHWADEAAAQPRRAAGGASSRTFRSWSWCSPVRSSSTRVRAGEAGWLPTSRSMLRPLDERCDRASSSSPGRSRRRGQRNRATVLAFLAGGNPLFIEQLAAALAETGEVPTSLPTTIRGIIAARLDALPAAEREVVLDAAVSGRVFWRGSSRADDGGSPGSDRRPG